MNYEDLTIKEAKEIVKMFGGIAGTSEKTDGLNCQIGEYVIIRTYSAGVWFGKLEQKSGNEVILTEARRMYFWKAKKSISLSGVAIYGIDEKESKICPAIKKQWLEAIEIISMTDVAIESLKGAKDVEAK